MHQQVDLKSGLLNTRCRFYLQWMLVALEMCIHVMTNDRRMYKHPSKREEAENFLYPPVIVESLFREKQIIMYTLAK